MRSVCRFLAVAAVTTFLCAPASAAAAARTPPASTLLARVTRPRDELNLLGQSSGASSLLGRAAASELKFTNRDGYEFTLVAFGQTVALSVSNGHHGKLAAAARRFSTTTYLAHGRTTPTSIRASFGERGRIALRFQPSGRELHASRHAGCRRPSGSVIARLGLFIGELRFDGEDGYTSAEVHRVHGGSVDLAALVSCRPGGALPGSAGLSALPRLSGPASRAAVSLPYGGGPTSPAVPTHPSRGPKRTVLLASLKLPLSRTVFGAQLRGKGQVRFLAAEEAGGGQVGIFRLAGASAPASAFVFDDSLADAAVAPPPPFSGSGVFKHGIGAEKSWTGSLAVSFLGAPQVPLTGSPFRTQLFRGW
jgi:hypothetical protein